jgi:hypothetical protein
MRVHDAVEAEEKFGRADATGESCDFEFGSFGHG